MNIEGINIKLRDCGFMNLEQEWNNGRIWQIRYSGMVTQYGEKVTG